MPKPEECRYTKTHEWIFIEGQTGTAGLSDHAQHEITDVVFVELPKTGKAVEQGKPCAVVESVKAAFDFYAPMSGETVQVNEAVKNDPSLVNKSPHEDGWFFKIKISNPAEVSALMDFAAYQEFLKR